MTTKEIHESYVAKYQNFDRVALIDEFAGVEGFLVEHLEKETSFNDVNYILPALLSYRIIQNRLWEEFNKEIYK